MIYTFAIMRQVSLIFSLLLKQLVKRELLCYATDIFYGFYSTWASLKTADLCIIFGF